jgi:hypothetical protein
MVFDRTEWMVKSSVRAKFPKSGGPTSTTATVLTTALLSHTDESRIFDDVDQQRECFEACLDLCRDSRRAGEMVTGRHKAIPVRSVRTIKFNNIQKIELLSQKL